MHDHEAGKPSCNGRLAGSTCGTFSQPSDLGIWDRGPLSEYRHRFHPPTAYNVSGARVRMAPPLLRSRVKMEPT
jgi:hypothetical protein